jgi:penicillin V acylase-like amidase (Ntn superfamily)
LRCILTTVLPLPVQVTLIAALLCCALPRPADACTTFMLERGGERVVGKSYDWYMGQGLLIVNKRPATAPRSGRRATRA